MAGANRPVLGAVYQAAVASPVTSFHGESDGHLPAVLLSGEPVTAWPKVR